MELALLILYLSIGAYVVVDAIDTRSYDGSETVFLALIWPIIIMIVLIIGAAALLTGNFFDKSN